MRSAGDAAFGAIGVRSSAGVKTYDRSVGPELQATQTRKSNQEAVYGFMAAPF
jgi:hypothetical protein